MPILAGALLNSVHAHKYKVLSLSDPAQTAWSKMPILQGLREVLSLTFSAPYPQRLSKGGPKDNRSIHNGAGAANVRNSQRNPMAAMNKLPFIFFITVINHNRMGCQALTAIPSSPPPQKMRYTSLHQLSKPHRCLSEGVTTTKNNFEPLTASLQSFSCFGYCMNSTGWQAP
jgi:hypothetical protein